MFLIYIYRPQRDSNSRPPAYKAGAITAMLWSQFPIIDIYLLKKKKIKKKKKRKKKIGPGGIEPPTFCVLSRRDNHYTKDLFF